MDKKESLEAGKKKSYSSLWGQCTQMMKNELEACTDFQNMRDNEDPIALIKNVKGVTHDFKDQKYSTGSMWHAHKQLHSCIQKEDEDTKDCFERFKNQMEVMKYLKEKGANINYTHPVTRFNALHHAAFNGNKKMVKYLIDIGIEQKNLKGDVSLIRALNEDNKADMAKYVASLGMKDEGCTEKRCF